MTGDALWYEAAQVVGITNALNVADGGPAEAAGLLEPVDARSARRAPLSEIRTFYRGAVPRPLVCGLRPRFAADLWAAVRRIFADDGALARREALAFSVSVTTRSASGAAFHLAEMRRLGVGQPGVMEIVGVTQMFSSYTKIADTLQLESDMGGIAPVDSTPAPGGPAR
jgi:hypothetical protein